MVRQRAPYWMYSLEELRCDLTAFGEAVELEREGLSFARNVQYAILFDRLLRFPITGTRVRNYDGLGGQLLFAYLHHGRLPALDRQPPDVRVGPRRGRRDRRCATRSTRCTAPGSTAPSCSTGRRRTTSSPATCRRPRARAGSRARVTSTRSRIRGLTATSCSRTSSRCRSSTRRCRARWRARDRASPAQARVRV